MPLNHRKVVRYLNEALSHGRRNASGLVNQLDLAAQRLYERRNSGVRDLELAAAEHYMVARHLVASGTYSRWQVVAMARSYTLLKANVLFGGGMAGSIAGAALGPIGSIVGGSIGRDRAERALRHNPDHPTTPPHPEILGWGILGADTGESDRRHVGIPSPSFRIPSEAFGFSDTSRRYVEEFGLQGYVN